MLKVSGLRPDGLHEKKGKKCVKSLGNKEKKKTEEWSWGKKRMGEKTAHDSP